MGIVKICWNIMEIRPKARQILINSLVPIKYHTLIQVPKLQEKLTLGNIENLDKFENWEEQIGKLDLGTAPFEMHEDMKFDQEENV